MNLILQAIKSTFRGLANKVEKNTKRIDGHSDDIRVLQTGVDENRPFIVMVRYSQDEKAYIASHTNAEIYEAYQNGKRIILNWEDYEIGRIFTYSTVISMDKTIIRFIAHMNYGTADSGTYVYVSYCEINNEEFISGIWRLALHK